MIVILSYNDMSIKNIQNENLKIIRKPSLVVNTVSNWASLLVNILIGFLVTPLLIEKLRADKYGVWVLIISIVGYSGLLDLGITAASMRYLARYAGKKDYEKLNETINSSLIIFCLVGLIVVIASLFVAAPLARFFRISSQDYSSFKIAIQLTGISAGLMFPDRLLGVLILANERFVLSNIAKIVNIVAKGILSVLVLCMGGQLVGLSLVFVAVGFISVFINLTFIKILFKEVKFSFKYVNALSCKHLVSFGFFSILAQGGVFLGTQLSLAIVGRFCEVKMVGVYGLAIMLIGYLRRLIIGCVGVTQPRLSSLAGTTCKRKFCNSLMLYSTLISNLAVGCGFIAFCLVKDFLLLWLPESYDYMTNTSLLFVILLVGAIPALIVDILVNALQAINKHPYYAYQVLIEGVFSVILSIILVNNYGVFGVAIGVTIPSLIAKVIVQPIYCARLIEFGWAKYMLHIVIKPLCFAAIAVVLKVGLISELSATSYIQLCLKGIILSLAYALPAYWFCLDKSTRQILLSRFKGKAFA